MFSPSSHTALKYMFKYGELLNVIPFEWNSDSNTVSFTKSKVRLRIFTFITCYMWLESLYQFRVLYLEGGNDPVSESYLKIVAHFVSRLLATIYQTWGLFLNNKYSSLFNQLFRVNQFFQGVSRKRSKVARNQIDRCSNNLWVILVICVIQPLTVMFAYILDYQDRKYWQSHVPGILYPYVIPLFALDELVLSIYSLLGVTVIVCPVFIQTVLTAEWLQIVRILQLFNKSFNEAYSFITGYAIITLFLITALTSTSAVRLYNKLAFPANLMFPIGEILLIWAVIFIMRPGAHLKHLSDEIIKEYGASAQKKRRAAGRSLKSLRIEICSNFILKNSTVSTYLSEAANATVIVLLMT
ncbi:unnamed protein product [Allacma fusca]|uniref:Uncharacterized protein n=1 Tax=Allacma fusca TaxID=39272 RepID=A0A8J2KEE1_9HEXA|nr:unnamed protein product [Allacma fusca]